MEGCWRQFGCKKPESTTSVLSRAGDFGGTWYWNRYPGAQCDVEGYLYLPLLEETGYIPKERYSFAPEIFAHARRIGKHFHLYEKACFQTKIKEARWDDEAGRWTVTTDRGDVFKTRFVIMSSGPLNKPKLPGFRALRNSKDIPSIRAVGIRLHRRGYHRRIAQTQ